MHYDEHEKSAASAVDCSNAVRILIHEESIAISYVIYGFGIIQTVEEIPEKYLCYAALKVNVQETQEKTENRS